MIVDIEEGTNHYVYLQHFNILYYDKKNIQ